MAGYKPQRKIYKLKFQDTELEGLEVLASSVSMGEILKIQELAEGIQEKVDATEAVKLSRLMIGMFAKALVSWNLLDEDDKPVPATAKGALDQDPQLVMAIVKAWVDAVAGVSAPLDGGSPSGEPSLEASLTMAPLSPSPTS